MSRIVKDLVKGLPETIQPIMESKHLNYIFGLESTKKPGKGRRWNKVKLFPQSYPTLFQMKKSQSSSQGHQPGLPNQRPAQAAPAQKAPTPNKITSN